MLVNDALKKIICSQNSGSDSFIHSLMHTCTSHFLSSPFLLASKEVTAAQYHGNQRKLQDLSFLLCVHQSVLAYCSQL